MLKINRKKPKLRILQKRLFYLRLTVKIFQFLRLSTKFLTVLRLSVNPIEPLYKRFLKNEYSTSDYLQQLRNFNERRNLVKFKTSKHKLIIELQFVTLVLGSTTLEEREVSSRAV